MSGMWYGEWRLLGKSWLTSFGGFIISSSGTNVEQSGRPWIAEPQAGCHGRLCACSVGSATGKSTGKLKQSLAAAGLKAARCICP